MPFRTATKAAPADTGTPGKRSRSEVARLAALARWGKYKPGQKTKPKGRKPAKTPEAKEAERRQAAMDNRANVANQMGISADDQAALDALAMGQQPENADALIAAGIAEKSKDGQVRLTASGRMFYNAASRGDAGAAGDALGRGKDRVAPKEKEGAEAEKPKAGGGGGGTEDKDAQTKEKTNTARAAIGTQMAQNDEGLSPSGTAALLAFADGGPLDKALAPGLREMGLTEGDPPRLSSGGRAAVAAMGKGDYRATVDAINAAKERKTTTDARNQKKTERDTQRAADAAQRAKDKEARAKKRSARAAVRNVRVFRQARAEKAMSEAQDSAGGYLTGVRFRKRKRMSDDSATKQTAQDRAMFANMGSSGGGEGGGKKPSGGQGGLWKRGPDGKRTPEAGVQAPKVHHSDPTRHRKGDDVRVNLTQSGRATVDATVVRRGIDGSYIVRLKNAKHGSQADQEFQARGDRIQPRGEKPAPVAGAMKPPRHPSEPAPVQDKPRAQTAFREFQARQAEATTLTRQANRLEAEASQARRNDPARAKTLEQQAKDARQRARVLDTHPDNVRNLQEIEAAGYQVSGPKGDRIRPSTTGTIPGAPEGRTVTSRSGRETRVSGDTAAESRFRAQRAAELTAQREQRAKAKNNLTRIAGLEKEIRSRRTSLARMKEIQKELSDIRSGKALTMDSTKASRRHSAQDITYGLQARTKLQEADDLLLLAGFDDAPDVASVPWEGKAIDLETHCQIVRSAVHEALEEAEEIDDDEQTMGKVNMVGCQITVYDDYAIACLDDGRDIKIGYTLDGIDVEIDDPEEWMLVEAEWNETGDYEADDDAVKSLGSDRIGGYAVRFGSEEEPDLSDYRDYFTKSTDFWLDAWPQRPMLYHHAQDEATKNAPVVGMWTSATVDDVGVWLEGQLNSAHRYATAIKEMIRRGALRLSSDSAPHLVVREAKSNGAHEIKRWPMLACSLTVSPAEPRLLSVRALKMAFHDAGLLPPAEIDDDLADDPERPRDGSSVKRRSDPDATAIELELLEIAAMEFI